MFANRSKEDVIYPLTVKEIALAQERGLVLKKLTKMEKYSTHLLEDTEVQCKDGKMVIPKVLQHRAVSWYPHYLSNLDTHVLKRHLTQQCTGKVCEIPSDHTSKTVANVKLINNTSTSMGNSLLSLSSQTLGKHYVWTSLDHTLSQVKMGQKLTLHA